MARTINPKSAMHALIIEDEYLVSQLIEDWLRELGYSSFASAMDEDAAVAEAAKRCPDLITSDVQLSLGNGVDAIRRICEHQQGIPVVFITGVAAIVRERCPWAVIIQKPFGKSDLLAGVQEARKAA